ncbi:MAG: tail fiber domain-containing protein [Flavobacteriaceae bacterium]
MLNYIDNTGDGLHEGTTNHLRGTGNGQQTATYNIIDNTGTAPHIGVRNELSGIGSGFQYGNYTNISNSGNGGQYGTYNLLGGGGTGNHHGTYNSLLGTGIGDQYGSVSSIGNSGDGWHYAYKGTTFGSGSGEHHGFYSDIIASGTGANYGIRNYVHGAGTGNKYGSHNFIPSGAGGTHFGVYSDVTKVGSYAGYFLGTVAIGTNTVNTYSLPASRGIANQIMQTDGAGNTSWTDATAAVIHSINDLTDGKSDAFGSSVFLGLIAGNNDDGNNRRNTGVGYAALSGGVTGEDNTAIGYGSLGSTGAAIGNTAVGSFALGSNQDGFDNVGIGYASLGLNETGIGNVALGAFALNQNQLGHSNIGIGHSALRTNNGGLGNIGIGFEAAFLLDGGSDNVTIGASALHANTFSSENTIVGGQAAYNNQIGYNNTFLGARTGYNNISGHSNVFLGSYAGYNELGSERLYIENSNANANNALIYGEFDTNLLRINGRTEITATTDASGTVGTGVLEVGGSLRIDGNEIITNTNSVLFIQSDNNGDVEMDGGTFRMDASTNRVGINTSSPDYTMSVSGTLNLNEDIASGVALRVNGSEALWYNGTYFSWGFGGTANYFADPVGIGVTGSGFQLELSGNSAAKPTSSAWTVVSDERLKTNVHAFNDGLDVLEQINPVWFTYNGKAGMPTETGVGTIAQQLQKIAPYMVKEWEYQPEGIKSGEKYLGVDYGAMDFVLINAIKEQQKEIETLKARLEKLEALLLKDTAKSN